MAFVQTPHTLVPANAKNLMSVDNTRPKRVIVPISRAMVTPAHLPVSTWDGGAYGDEYVAEANVKIDTIGPNAPVGDYGPRNRTEQLAWPGTPNSVVPIDPLEVIPDYVEAKTINEPRGWISPAEPYGPAPVSPTDDPTITSLAPNTGVSGQNPTWVTITGTKFTINSWVETGNVNTPYFRYISPTRIDVLMDPRSSPGIVVVKVVDHGVKSNGSNFTFS